MSVPTTRTEINHPVIVISVTVMTEIITEYPQFFAATNLEWKMLLYPDKYKDVIIESRSYIVNDNRVIIYGFVIMPNHIHLIWQMKAGRKRKMCKEVFETYCSGNKSRYDLK